MELNLAFVTGFRKSERELKRTSELPRLSPRGFNEEHFKASGLLHKRLRQLCVYYLWSRSIFSI